MLWCWEYLRWWEWFCCLGNSGFRALVLSCLLSVLCDLKFGVLPWASVISGVDLPFSVNIPIGMTSCVGYYVNDHDGSLEPVGFSGMAELRAWSLDVYLLKATLNLIDSCTVGGQEPPDLVAKVQAWMVLSRRFLDVYGANRVPQDCRNRVVNVRRWLLINRKWEG